MKKIYKVQVVIDIVIIAIAFLIYLFPQMSELSAGLVFYTLMCIYAGLELCEFFISDMKLKESLYLFIASATAAFSGFFLKEYNPNIVLSITLVVWLLMIAIIKIISFENIDKKKSNLFAIKLGALSVLIFVGLTIGIYIYFKIEKIGYMLGLMYLTYGFLELMSDFLEFLSTDTRYIKE